MLTWLFAALVLYYVQLFLPAAVILSRIGLPAYLGARDAEPVLTGMGARVMRATRNMRENFPAFAKLAVASLALGLQHDPTAILGAQIFVVSRTLYVPLYAFAVPLARSLAATAGWIGMILIASALAGSL